MPEELALSKRAAKRVESKAVRDQACRRLHRLIALNANSRLKGFESALLDLSIDISTHQPGSYAMARALLGLDEDADA